MQNYFSTQFIRGIKSLWTTLNKIPLVMKLITMLLIISISLVKAADSYAQKALVNLEAHNQTVQDVLDEIENQSDYTFFFNNKHVDLNRRVSVNANKSDIFQVLNTIFEGTNVRYSVVDRKIVLSAETASVSQQKNTKSITGKIIDANKEPVIGVNVIVKGQSSIGTITDIDGNFTLNVPENSTLQVSYIGYNTQEVPVEGKTTFNIVLKEDTKTLDEVVVVGYGTMKKSDITGSVASVKVDDLKEGVSTSVDQMLVGKSAGVNVVQSSGEPGGGFSVNIRGASSINGGVSPLYVIDGIPIDNSRPVSQGSIVGFDSNRSPRNPMSSINPADIESIEILKDASATAIYGSRGANGVILITTRGGKEEKTKVSYSGYVGIQNPSRKLDLLNAADYKRVLNEIIDAGGELEASRVGDIANNGSGTDWQNEVTTRNAIVHEHQLSFSGGTKKTVYYTSFNYINQEGIVKNTSFERIGARVNLKTDVNKNLKIGLNATGTYMKDHFVANGFGVNEFAGVMNSAYNYDPTLPVRDADGNFALSPLLSIDNPVALDEGMKSYSDTYRILASAFGEYHFTDDFFARLNLGTDFMNESRKSFVSSETIAGRNYKGVAGNQNSEKSNFIVEGTLNYNKTFKKHNVGALFGMSYQRFVTSYLNNKASDFPNESLGADNLGLGNQETFRIQNSVTGNRLASYIGRANYSYDDKYLATVTFRADGSSRFGKNNKFGYFPSAAVAWKISNEAFLKNVEQITSLKLRLGWGRTGNQEIGDYPAMSTYSQAGSAIWDGKQVVGTAPAKIPNPDLKWETTDQFNIGLDFGVFNNRINGGVDYFRKKTTDMLLQLPVPQSTGYNSILSNIGRIDNNGVEFFINTVNVDTKNFNWQSNITFSAMKNKVVDLGGIDEIIIGAGYTHVEQVAIRKPGLPLNSYYGWEVAGVWQEGDDFSKMKTDYKPGDLKYVDQNKDGVINDADRVVLGDSFPDFQWSFGNTFSYKGIELYVFFEGVQGVKMLNGNLIDCYFPISFRRNKFSEPYLNRWTPDNPTNEYPSFVSPLKDGRKVVNSRTLSDASYVRLKTIRLSYTLPKLIKEIQSLQLYVTAENLFTITDYVGLDPAINPNNNTNFRMDFNAYPSAKTFIFGIKLDF